MHLGEVLSFVRGVRTAYSTKFLVSWCLTKRLGKGLFRTCNLDGSLTSLRKEDLINFLSLGI